MGSFCPIIKEACKQNECVFWDASCLLIQSRSNAVVLQKENKVNNSTSSQRKVKLDMRAIALEINKEMEEEAEAAVPDGIKNCSIEELAEEILVYAKENVEDSEDREYLVYDMIRDYWTEKGVNRYDFPLYILQKLDKAEALASRQWKIEVVTIQKNRLNQERARLPQIIEDCVKWAKENNIKNLKKGDVNAFLLDKDIKILQSTKDILYSKANALMNSETVL
jgi:hypothetical protein